MMSRQWRHSAALPVEISMSKSNSHVVAQNRRARHDYFIDDTIEAGIILAGSEVKSIRAGKANIAESYAGLESGEIYLINAYIPEYQAQARMLSHEARRPRKLLLHKREINRLSGAVKRNGATLIPLNLHINERGRVKVLIGVARGKKNHDKRAAQRDRDWNREKSRILREHR